jgi:hypothetical protein
MNTYPELCDRLSCLEQELTTLQSQDYLLDARIDSAVPGGNATGEKATQYRLRMKGKPARYLGSGQRGAALAAQYRQQIARGKQIRRLQREIRQITQQLEHIVAIAQQYGLELPKSLGNSPNLLISDPLVSDLPLPPLDNHGHRS